LANLSSEKWWVPLNCAQTRVLHDVVGVYKYYEERNENKKSGEERITNSAGSALLYDQNAVEVGYNDLGSCNTSSTTLYIQWYEQILHKALAFLLCLIRHI
jgi:SPX domain protein involved in polyphosphate accumulation